MYLLSLPECNQMAHNSLAQINSNSALPPNKGLPLKSLTIQLSHEMSVIILPSPYSHHLIDNTRNNIYHFHFPKPQHEQNNLTRKNPITPQAHHCQFNLCKIEDHSSNREYMKLSGTKNAEFPYRLTANMKTHHSQVKEMHKLLW